MRQHLTALVVVALMLGPSAFADETINNVEYMTGHAGMKKQKGKISITGTELQFLDGDKVLFAVPLATITKVNGNRETDNGSPLSNALWGWSPKTEDFVYVTTESATTAEGLVFRVKRKMAAGVAAKIEFAAKKAKG